MDESNETIRLSRQLLEDVAGIPQFPDDPIPRDIAVDYAKRIAAQKLGELTGSRLAEASLVRTSLSQGEDDRVRVESVQQLMRLRSRHVETVLLGLLFDNDPEMRLTAVEGLVLLGGNLLSIAAAVLANDKNSEVRKRIELAHSSRDIPLYKLDPI